jgi:hypothetical protein
MSFCEAFGEGPFHLATGDWRYSLSIARPAFDAARGHRLAEAAEDVDTRDRRMSDDEVSPVFIGVLLLHSDEIDGIIIA